MRPAAKRGNVPQKSLIGEGDAVPCTAEQIRDFQAAFHSPAAADNAEQCPPPLQAKAVAPPPLTAAQRTLTMGIWMYEDGDYGGSENYLKSALSLDTTDVDRVRAHKYLAFILCAERREQECRREFREALAIDPKFELTPAEQGPPTWGPVFRSLKPASASGR